MAGAGAAAQYSGRPHSPLATSPRGGQGYIPGLERTSGGGGVMAGSHLAEGAGAGLDRRHTAAAARISSPQHGDLLQPAPFNTSPPRSPPSRGSRLSTARSNAGGDGLTGSTIQKPGSAGGTMYCTASSSLVSGGLATVRARSAAKGVPLPGVSTSNLDQDPAVVVAGVPVNRRTGSNPGSMLTIDHAADMPLCSTGTAAAHHQHHHAQQQRPANVPRLDLSAVTGGSSSTAAAAAGDGGTGWGGGSTSRSDAFLSSREGLALPNVTARAQASTRLATVVEAGSVLSSARPSYRLQPGAAQPPPLYPLGSHLVAHATAGPGEEGHPDVEGVWQLLPAHLRGSSSLHAAMQGAGHGSTAATGNSNSSSSRAAGHLSPRGGEHLPHHISGSSSRAASPTGRHPQQQQHDGSGGCNPVVVRSDPWGSQASSALTHHHARQVQPLTVLTSPPATADAAGAHMQQQAPLGGGSSRASSPRRCREGALLRQTAAAGFAPPSSRYLNAPSSAKAIAPRQLLTTGQIAALTAAATAAVAGHGSSPVSGAAAAAAGAAGASRPQVPALNLPGASTSAAARQDQGRCTATLTSRLTPQVRDVPHRGAMTARLPGASSTVHHDHQQYSSHGQHGGSPRGKAGQQLVATNLGLLPCAWGPKSVTRVAPGRGRGSCGGGSTGGAAEGGCSSGGAGSQHHSSTAAMLSNSPLATWRQREGGGSNSDSHHQPDTGAGHRRSSTGAGGSMGGCAAGALPRTATLRSGSMDRKAAGRHPHLCTLLSQGSGDVSNGQPHPYTPRGKAKPISIW